MQLTRTAVKFQVSCRGEVHRSMADSLARLRQAWVRIAAAGRCQPMSGVVKISAGPVEGSEDEILWVMWLAGDHRSARLLDSVKAKRGDESDVRNWDRSSMLHNYYLHDIYEHRQIPPRNAKKDAQWYATLYQSPERRRLAVLCRVNPLAPPKCDSCRKIVFSLSTTNSIL